MRGNPIATSPRPSDTGTLHFATEFTGAGVLVVVGVGVGVGVEVGEGVGAGEVVGVAIGIGVGVGVGESVGDGAAGFAIPKRCQTNFLFLLTHLN